MVTDDMKCADVDQKNELFFDKSFKALLRKVFSFSIFVPVHKNEKINHKVWHCISFIYSETKTFML